MEIGIRGNAAALNIIVEPAALPEQPPQIERGFHAELGDMPRIHLWLRRVFTGLSGKVQGFTPYPDGIIRLKGLRLS